MEFKIYSFNRASYQVDEKTAVKETDASFMLPPQRWNKNPRLAKSTYDGQWRKNREEALRDGINWLEHKVSSLESQLSNAQWALDSLKKEIK